MSDTSRQGTTGMPRLSHAEAENLISARSDAPLPPEQNRLLLAHLSTCPSCRAFADQLQAMTRALRDLPMLPASPTVARQVRERIAQPQSPWARLANWMFSGKWGAMPAVATALVLVAAMTFSLILRGDGSNNGPNIVAPNLTDVALKQTGTATPTPTEIARQQNPPTTTPQVTTQDVETPALPNLQVTLTPTSEPTSTPTATATSEPTNTPVATATATNQPTATMEPTETPTKEPTATRTATEEPSATATSEPTETSTTEPTAMPTETPTEQPTDTPEPTETPTEEPTARPTRTPTETPTATPTETPTEEPPAQPTITGIDRNNGSTPDETPSDEPTESAGQGGDVTPEPAPTETPGSSLIVPTDGNPDEVTETPTEESGDQSTAEAETPTSESGNTELQTVSGPLAEATTLGELGPGVDAPPGGLRMPADNVLMVVTGPDGGLAIVDAEGNLVQGLGAAASPIWSPLGMVLLYSDLNGGAPAVATWDREDPRVYQIGADPGESGPAVDVPAGWIGDQLYYLRTFPNQPGYVELHAAGWDGADDRVVWSSDGIEPGGARPLTTLDGVLIPTTTSWIFVDTAGNESDFGPNDYVMTADPLLSDGGSLVAYPAGGQLIIAEVTSPGVPQAVIPYDGSSGFDFGPGGEQIVVSDGQSLQIYSTQDGSLIVAAASESGTRVIAPHWSEDGIRYLEVGETTRLKLVQADAFAQ